MIEENEKPIIATASFDCRQIVAKVFMVQNFFMILNFQSHYLYSTLKNSLWQITINNSVIKSTERMDELLLITPFHFIIFQSSEKFINMKNLKLFCFILVFQLLRGGHGSFFHNSHENIETSSYVKALITDREMK